MKILYKSYLFVISMLLTFNLLASKDAYHPLNLKEMEIPKESAPNKKEMDTISKDMLANGTFNLTGSEKKEIEEVKSSKINIDKVVYASEVPLKNVYAQTASCKILKYDFDKKKWCTVCSNFNQKGYEPYKIIVSPNEKYVAIIMQPDGGKGFYVKILNLTTGKLKNIGEIMSTGWFFFNEERNSFIIVEQYAGKVKEIKLEK